MPKNPFINTEPLGISGSSKSKKETSSKREGLPMIWKDKILMKQKNKCAGKKCVELHNGKRVMVNTRNNFDHIIPRALNGKHIPSNIQALCANCHQLKTREDRFKISQSKKKVTKRVNSPKQTINNSRPWELP